MNEEELKGTANEENEASDLSELDSLGDLESQLAALDMGGDDFGESLFGETDDPLAAFAELEKLAEQSIAEPAVAEADDGEMDLDKQIELLMKADEVAGEKFDVSSIAAMGPTHTIYDPEAEGVVIYQKGSKSFKDITPKPKLFENITVVGMIATAVIGLLFIIVGTGTALWVSNELAQQQADIEAVAHFLPIIMPENVANNANAIFINQRTTLQTPLTEQQFTLSRISAGYTGTLFYFDEYFNPNDYYFILSDQDRHLYMHHTVGIQTASNAGTILKFDTLNVNTLFLTLRIQCRQTAAHVNFYFRFLSPPAVNAPIYVTHPHFVYDENSPVISHAIFDDASSQIHYRFTHDPQRPGFRRRIDSESPFILLRDIFTAVTVLTNENTDFYFEEFGVYLGTAAFSPVFSLDSNVSVVFNDLVYFHPNVTHNVTARQLLENDQNNPITIQTGDFRLMLEGMAQQGYLLVLVLHGLDENSRRMETIPDMVMQINLGNGNSIHVPGQVHSVVRGSDIIFDIEPYLDQIRTIPISQYSLIIHSVEYSLPSMSVPLALSTQLMTLPSTRRIAAEISVHEAFMGLLAYKSGEISTEGLIGLSAKVLNNSEFMSIFERNNISQLPMYGANLVTGNLMSNYDFIGIIEVQWIYGEGANMHYFHEAFRVVAQSQDAIWRIVSVDLL